MPIKKKILLLRTNIEIARKHKHPVNFRPPYTLKYIEALLLTKNSKAILLDAYAQGLRFEKYLELSFQIDADIIVVSSTILDIKTTINYAKIVKERKKDTIIILTGPGPSVLNEGYKHPSIDFILCGESEYEIISIIQRISEGEPLEFIKNKYQRKNTIFTVSDINLIPKMVFSKKEMLMYFMNYPVKTARKLIWGHIITSRGCPHECIFCSPLMRDSFGKNMRYRNSNLVVDEMEYQISLGANIICVDDDNFTTSKKHVLSICKEIIKRNLKIPWVIHARVDDLDSELLVEMKNAGCNLLRIGVESGSQRIIEIINKSKEKNWAGKVKHIFKLIKKVGINTLALFIVGNPTETKQEILQSIKLAKNINPDIIQLCFFTPFPGTKIYDENKVFFKANFFLEKTYHYEGKEIHNLSCMEKSELIKMYKIFYRAFLYNPIFLVKHFFKYFLFYVFNFHVFLNLFNIKEYLKINMKSSKVQ